MSEIIQVRNVPKKVHSELVRQAKAAGLSLNKYLLGEFERMAGRGRNAELLRKAHALVRQPATKEERRRISEQIVRDIREGREERDEEIARRLR
jgi:hypothetical protein